MNRWLLVTIVKDVTEKLKIQSHVLGTSIFLLDQSIELFKTTEPTEKPWHEKCEPLLVAAVCIHLASKIENSYVSMTSLLEKFFEQVNYNRTRLYEKANTCEAYLVVELGVSQVLAKRASHWELLKIVNEWKVSQELRVIGFHLLFQILEVTPFSRWYSPRIIVALSLYIASVWTNTSIHGRPIAGNVCKQLPPSAASTDDDSNHTGAGDERDEFGWWCFIYASLRRKHLNQLTKQFLDLCEILPLHLRVEMDNKEESKLKVLEHMAENQSAFKNLDSRCLYVLIPNETDKATTTNNNSTTQTNGATTKPTQPSRSHQNTPVLAVGLAVVNGGAVTPLSSQDMPKDMSSQDMKSKKISMADYRSKHLQGATDDSISMDLQTVNFANKQNINHDIDLSNKLTNSNIPNRPGAVDSDEKIRSSYLHRQDSRHSSHMSQSGRHHSSSSHKHHSSHGHKHHKEHKSRHHRHHHNHHSNHHESMKKRRPSHSSQHASESDYNLEEADA